MEKLYNFILNNSPINKLYYAKDKINEDSINFYILVYFYKPKKLDIEKILNKGIETIKTSKNIEI